MHLTSNRCVCDPPSKGDWACNMHSNSPHVQNWEEINGTKDHTQPPLSLSSNPGSSYPHPLIAPELEPNSEPGDPSVLFLESPSQNRCFVWEDRQQLTLAPTFFNLHNPRGLIKDQGEYACIARMSFVTHPLTSCLSAEGPTSPVRNVAVRSTGENDRNIDGPGFFERRYFSNSGFDMRC